MLKNQMYLLLETRQVCCVEVLTCNAIRIFVSYFEYSVSLKMHLLV
jgi:hypothetical protein